MTKPNRASKSASGILIEVTNETDVAALSGTRRSEARTGTRKQTDDEPEPEPERKKRREDGDGDLQKLAAKFSRHLTARKIDQFRKAARRLWRRVRIIRLSREEWGASDAHLQNTLNLFDQINSRSTSHSANNSRAFRSHFRPLRNYNSLRR
jgi:hypothetical protein